MALRPALTLTLAISTLLPACSDDPVPVDPPAIAWSDCGGGFECATFSVPFSHDAPDGRTFALPLVRRPALDPSTRIGSLLVNPGGPGGSGVAWVRAASFFLPPSIQDRFDLVGFDPRGQAESVPGIDGPDELDPFVSLDFTPDDDTERAELLARTDAFVAGCEQKSGDVLKFVGTDHIVRDIDLLREALGEEKLSFLGLSYGTFLGAMYAETYPDHVRALVLDGALDPAISGDAFIEGQALGFEGALDAFLTDCAANDACAFHSGGDPFSAYDALRDAIEKAPLPAPPGSGRALGPGAFAYAVSVPLYRRSRWKTLAAALAEAAAGDGAALLELADGYLGRKKDGTYGDSLADYYGVLSIDFPFAADAAVYESMTNDLLVKAPRLGAYFPYSALASARWPVEAWRSPGPVSAVGAPPILVVGATNDPATPYAWSVALAGELSSGVLLTREGEGHISFLTGNDCVDRAIADYLVDLAVPPKGSTCP